MSSQKNYTARKVKGDKALFQAVITRDGKVNDYYMVAVSQYHAYHMLVVRGLAVGKIEFQTLREQVKDDICFMTHDDYALLVSANQE